MQFVKRVTYVTRLTKTPFGQILKKYCGFFQKLKNGQKTERPGGRCLSARSRRTLVKALAKLASM